MRSKGYSTWSVRLCVCLSACLSVYLYSQTTANKVARKRYTHLQHKKPSKIIVITVAKHADRRGDLRSLPTPIRYLLPNFYLQCYSRNVLNQALPPISVLGGQRSQEIIAHEVYAKAGRSKGQANSHEMATTVEPFYSSHCWGMAFRLLYRGRCCRGFLSFRNETFKKIINCCLYRGCTCMCML